MKKIFSIILIIFCIFSFNICFQVNSVYAQNVAIEDVIDPNLAEPQDGDVLEKPVFDENEVQQTSKNKIKGSLFSLIIKIFGGILLTLVVIICLSFIWVANLQRKKEKTKKQVGADINVINAVDNFARHRIKK